MKQFLSKCDEIGFENAYNKFIIENPEYKKEFLRIFFNYMGIYYNQHFRGMDIR